VPRTLLLALLSLMPALAFAQVELYAVGPGDVLGLKVFGEPELSGSYTVAEDGTVHIPLVGTVAAQGRSAPAISAELTRLLADGFLVQPQVNVQVETYLSQPVQVLGAVRRPGTFYLDGPTGLLGILAEAGGVLSENSQEVRVTRAGEEGSMVVNLEVLVSGGSADLRLKSGDVVFVSEGQVVYVSGQVAKPGPVSFRGGLTVTQALTGAGGPSPLANLRKAYILRDGVRIELNIKRIQNGRDRDMEVMPGDQIFVDESVF
jgi:polysaccharide export outer membrane protein